MEGGDEFLEFLQLSMCRDVAVATLRLQRLQKPKPNMKQSRRAHCVMPLIAIAHTTCMHGVGSQPVRLCMFPSVSDGYG